MKATFNPQVLDKIRFEQHIKSDEALGKKLGVSRSTIQNWRAGKSVPGLRDLAAMATLGVPLRETILYESPDSDSKQYAA